MGADEAILISGRPLAGSDTLATSYVLSSAINKIGDYDLILCGKQAFDGDTAQVPPGIAEHLGIPQVTYVIDLEVEGNKLRARRLLEGFYEVVEVRVPAVLSVVKHINEPRRAGLKDVLAAKKKKIQVWDACDIGVEVCHCGLDGSPTRVIRTFAPTREHEGEIIEGEPSDAARRLVEKLTASKII